MSGPTLVMLSLAALIAVGILALCAVACVFLLLGRIGGRK